MGIKPTHRAGQMTSRIASHLAGLALAVLMVQHSAERRACDGGKLAPRDGGR